jgi:2-C-methyl-D-erythritol 4-phosphate cytidylyltransferase
MTITALIPAAGTGRRMEATINKQYLELAGRPVLARTLAIFEQHPAIDHILIVAPADEVAYCQREIVERYGLSKVTAIIAGGDERQDSVRNGLRACTTAAADDLILIHDGARPLLSASLIDAIIAAARVNGACLAAVPVKDTIKRVENGQALDTPDRSQLWLAQTPQAFHYALIASAHERAVNDRFRATDDAQLAERDGHPVAVVMGSYRNIKITTPDDLPVAAALLSAEGTNLP